jgi:hypothetical protein
MSTAAQNDVVGQEIDVSTLAVADVCNAAGDSAVAGPAGTTATKAQVTQPAATTSGQIEVRSLDENVPMARVAFLIDETRCETSTHQRRDLGFRYGPDPCRTRWQCSPPSEEITAALPNDQHYTATIRSASFSGVVTTVALMSL